MTIQSSSRAALAVLALTSTLFTVPCLTAQDSQSAQSKARPRRQANFHFVQPEPINFDDHVGWTQIFDGKSLNGWDGDTDVWHVEGDAIVGESSPEHPSGTTNLIWKGGQPGNFILKLEMKLEGEGANGGIQYRSLLQPPTFRPMPEGLPPERQKQWEENQALLKKRAKWNMFGYQADFDYKNQWTGQLYEQSSPRGIVAWTGQVVATEPNKKPTLLAQLGTREEMKQYIKPGEWNQVEIIADGNTLTHIINGHIMAMLVDTDPEYAQAKGYIALEIEGPGVLKISHRNIWLKKLP